MFPVKQTVIYTFFCHKGSKSFQNIAFDSVFVMFPVKHTGIYTFFAITSVQNTCFCSVFNALASQKPCKILLCTMFFFIFGRFSIAGKLPKWPKIPFQYPLALRHPKILEKCRKHHRILVSVRNRFWAFGPPPPAKADIATAILTNVIEHLVLLFCPPISTPSPPKRCGRIFFVYTFLHILTHPYTSILTQAWNQTELECHVARLWSSVDVLSCGPLGSNSLILYFFQIKIVQPKAQKHHQMFKCSKEIRRKLTKQRFL